MKRTLCALSLLAALAAPAADVWHADNGDGTFTNPLLWGDWPDPDVIRVDDTFYMVSTSMHYVPGVPILQSKDLVNWTMAGYALDRYTEHPGYDMQGGTLYINGAWASTIRHHNGKFYVGFCTPYGRGTETGHFSLCEAEDVRGPWRRTIFPEYLYDPGLFIDDDGRAYVVHGQGTLWLTPLAEDLRSVAGPATKIWQGGFKKDRSLGGGFGMEGSHMYKVNGWYYILCPAGGTGGWQVCLRSKNLRGPYEHRIVMDDDGSYPGNGLHQGGMVQLQNGDWWFVIMQDRGPIGRVPCLVPVTWEDGWPVLGKDAKDAIVYAKPAIPGQHPVQTVATSDTFDSPTLGLQWQWNHNPDDAAWSLTERPGFLRLKARPATDLARARNTLSQRVQGPLSVATAAMETAGLRDGTTAGLAVFQKPHAFVAVRQREGRRAIVCCADGQTLAEAPLPEGTQRVWLRAFATDYRFNARFSYSLDGKTFTPIGGNFTMRLGYPWTGNRFALFAYRDPDAKEPGVADFDRFDFIGR